MSSSHTGEIQNQRNLQLDRLRGIAIVGVVSTHSIQLIDGLDLETSSELFSDFVNLGRYGVELFFFLSGWLLFSIYGFNGGKLRRKYLARRVARIYPLWIFFLFFSLARWEFTNSGQENTPLRAMDQQNIFLHSYFGIMILALTFTLFISASLWNSVIPGGWSIQAEIAHYLIFPIIRNKSPNLVFGVLIVVNSLTIVLVNIREKLTPLPGILLLCADAWIRLGFYSTFGFFVLGGFGYLVYAYFKEHQENRTKFPIQASPWIVIVYLISFVFVPCPFGNQLEAIGFLCLAIFASNWRVMGLQVERILEFLGRYSYFIYFMHFQTLALFSWVLTRVSVSDSSGLIHPLLFLTTTLISLTLSSLLAVPSMRYFECKFLIMARKIN